MRKFFGSRLALILSATSLASAFQTSTFLETTNNANAFSTDTMSSTGENSAYLFAADIDDPNDPNEARVRIEFNEDVTLNDIETISWMAYVNQGYIPHVDIIIDKSGDGSADDALVFEYDKTATPSDQAIGDMNYTRGAWVNTFDDKGLLDSNARGWLSSGDPGNLNNPGFLDGTLAEWKNGAADDATINGATKVIALEFEVDGWTAQSEAYLDDIMLNGEFIQGFEGVQGAQGEVLTDFTFIPSPNPLYFGQMFPGQSRTRTSMLSVGNSELWVMQISVQPDSGSVFNEQNVLFSTDNGANFHNVTETDPIQIAAETSKNVEVQLSIPSGTIDGSFSGTITYLVTAQGP